METPISKEKFAKAKKGTIIIDANGERWTFNDEPVRDVVLSSGDEKRSLKSPEGDIKNFIYTDIYGDNNIVDDEFAIVDELNSPKVELVPLVP